MPTPEAMEAAAEFLWPLYTDKKMPRIQFARGSAQCQKLASAFDRFAAQRGAEAERDTILAELRRQRDRAAASGDHAEALILNDRIRDFKEGRSSVTVERVMQQFESDLAARRKSAPPQTGGGDALQRHLTRDEVRIMDKALLKSSTLIHTGELAGGGDAGERARAIVAGPWSDCDREAWQSGDPPRLEDLIEAALRDARREAAEAMREAAAREVKPSRPFKEVLSDAANEDADFAARIAKAYDFIRMTLIGILRSEFQLVETAIRAIPIPE